MLEPPQTAGRVVPGGGTRYLLVDRQVRVEGGSASYTRHVSPSLNTAGVEDLSQVSITFDPTEDRLIIHHAEVRRGADVVDQPRRGRISVLQREPGLEDGVIDGSLTFSLVLVDVRIGDILDYSYTIEHRAPECGKRYYNNYQARWTSPVDFERLRVLHRVDRPLTVRNLTGAQPSISVRGGWENLEWRFTDLAPITNEPDRPAGYALFAGVSFGEVADWGEPVRLSAPVYVVREAPSPARDALIGKFRDIPFDSERIAAVLRFVQDEIRYTGIELGDRGYRPTSPNEMIDRRFGDSQDKTLLAARLLRTLGVDADPALVSTAGAARSRTGCRARASSTTRSCASTSPGRRTGSM